MLPLAASADLHDHLATNLNCVRLDRFRLFVARQRNGFANLPRNVAASTTPKPRAVICISPSSLRNSTLSPPHSFNYCFRWIFTRSVLKASSSFGLLLTTRNSVQSHELDYCYYCAHQQHTSNMKYRYVAIAASAATGVSAQAPPAYTPPAVSSPANSLPVAPISSPPVSYTTVTYDDCPSQSIQTLITVTNGVTVTYCPECHHSISPSASPAPSHTTVYTTVYQSLCSTGLVPVTYTVTEECAEPTPTWATGTAKDDHVPQGFTVTVKDCHVCDKTPVPVTITEPCKDGCGKPTPPPATATPAPAPSGGNVQQISDGQIQAPGPSGGSGGKNSPAPSGGNGGSGSPAPSGGASNPGSGSPNTGSQRPPASDDDSKCPGPQCAHDSSSPSDDKPAAPGGSPADSGNGPYPTGNSTTDKCPGPQCVKSSGGAGGNPDTPDVEESTGGANALSVGFVSSLCVATVVAALAFAL